MDLVIGLGETGSPLFEILSAKYVTVGIDIGNVHVDDEKIRFMNICFGFSNAFVQAVKNYQGRFKPVLTIIHSTVPIGTTSQIMDAVHSPINGRHDSMKADLLGYYKWIGGDRSLEALHYLSGAGFSCRTVKKSEETEAMKLMCLAKFGVSLAFADYQKSICKRYGFSYDDVIDWDNNYNGRCIVKRSILNAPNGKIGGHCVIPGTKLLNMQHPNQMLDEVMEFE